jgi:hypothetical protein
MPLVILHHLLNVSTQLANKRGFKQKKIILVAVEECLTSHKQAITVLVRLTQTDGKPNTTFSQGEMELE